MATVLAYVANRFHHEVEPLVWPGCWGYADRKIRGSSSVSNHASGTAIDLNAPKHPLAKSGTFTSAQEAAIRRMLADLHGVVRWGGDYHGRKDEMHFEINAGRAEVARVAAHLTHGPVTRKEEDMPTAEEIADAVWLRKLTLTLPDGKKKTLSAATWVVYTNAYVHRVDTNLSGLVKDGILTPHQLSQVTAAMKSASTSALHSVGGNLTREV